FAQDERTVAAVAHGGRAMRLPGGADKPPRGRPRETWTKNEPTADDRPPPAAGAPPAAMHERRILDGRSRTGRGGPPEEPGRPLYYDRTQSQRQDRPGGLRRGEP